MIPLCRRCGRRYWRYKRDHPPSGYCSVSCATKQGRLEAPEQVNASDVLAKIRLHRSQVHNTRELVRWWDGCATCEILEMQYVAMLSTEVRS